MQLKYAVPGPGTLRHSYACGNPSITCCDASTPATQNNNSVCISSGLVVAVLAPNGHSQCAILESSVSLMKFSASGYILGTGAFRSARVTANFSLQTEILVKFYSSRVPTAVHKQANGSEICIWRKGLCEPSSRIRIQHTPVDIVFACGVAFQKLLDVY